MSVTLPLGAQVQQPDEGASVEVQGSNSRYLKEFTDVAAEETASLEFTYIAPEGAVSSGTGPASGGSGATGLLLLLAGAGLGAMTVLVWRRMQQNADSDDRPANRRPSAPKDWSKPTSSATGAARAPSTKATGLSSRAKLMVAAAGLVGGALVFMMLASGNVGTVRTTDTGGITKVLTSAEADQVVSVPGRFQPGADIQHEASHVFETLEGLSGIGAVTVSSDGTTIDVEYASSMISGESITAMLESSGYAVPSAPSVDE
jgi:copper chaperone CopZ